MDSDDYTRLGETCAHRIAALREMDYEALLALATRIPSTGAVTAILTTPSRPQDVPSTTS